MLALLFFFLFPYIISNFSGVEKQKLETKEAAGEIWVLQRKFWGAVRIPLEEYLEGMLAATIPVEYHMETLKAQAVILRTFCVHHMEKQGGNKVIWDDNIKELYFSGQAYEKLWTEDIEEKRKKVEQAVKETKGMILVCNGEIPELPFVRISNGQTRDISEYVVHMEKFDYMKNVSCPEDIMAEKYIQYMEMTVEEFQKKIKKLLKQKNVSPDKMILYRDSAEYVKEVEVGGNIIDGETFKNALGLVSSCFYVEKIDHLIQIQTKGMGHGFGFSQYSANQMAENGKTYQYLLDYFFENIILEKI